MRKQNTHPPKLAHGGDWAGFQAEFGEEAPLLDFSANVSPLGLPEGIRRAICDAALHADRYPDPLCRALTAAIGERENCAASQVLCGNGAADLIWRAVLAVKPKRALIPAPTFAEYENALAAMGCAVDRYLLKQEHDFRLGEDFLDAITEETDMVFLCEPNNPTGLTASLSLRKNILEKCKKVGAILVEDDCFEDFLDDLREHSWKDAWKSQPNLLILKAFTKMYAMAGVRLGYCLCGSEALLSRMRESGQPWAVSSLAQAAGMAALKEDGYAASVQALIREERPWLRNQLSQLGLRVIPGEANYLLFQSPVPLIGPLRTRGILLRSCGNYSGLDDSWYRCAVRTHKENAALVAALQEELL